MMKNTSYDKEILKAILKYEGDMLNGAEFDSTEHAQLQKDKQIYIDRLYGGAPCITGEGCIAENCAKAGKGMAALFDSNQGDILAGG